MKKIAVALLAVMMAIVALFATGCGGGGLTNYFGLEKGNITKITYQWKAGPTPKTITADKYDEFMKVFDVEYEYCTYSDIKSGGEYVINYNYGGETKTIILTVQPDGRVAAQQTGFGWSSYYMSTEAIDIPQSLK